MADIIDLAAERDRRATAQRNAARLPQDWPDPVLFDLMDAIDSIDETDPAEVVKLFERWEAAYGR